MVVGSGVVGQATGKGFLSGNMGHNVTFVDISEELLKRLRGEGYQTLHLMEMDLRETEVVFVSVSTPTEDGRIVLDHLVSAITTIGSMLGRAIADHPGKYRVVVIRSTVPPGTTEERLIPILEQTSRGRVGQDFGVCDNPEYLREARAVEDFSNPRIVVIGENNPQAGEILEGLYRPFGCPIHRVSIREAELQKYIHNIWNAAKISFFNEMRQVAIALDIDPSKVFELVVHSAEAMCNPVYGTRDLGPYGGSCLPKDTEALLTFLEEMGISMPLLEAVIKVNRLLMEKGGVKK